MSTSSPTGAGPYETEHEAFRASAWNRDGMPLRGQRELNLEDLMSATTAAGVTLGAYEERIIRWLSGFEPSMCAAIAGIVRRAHRDGWDAGQAAADADGPSWRCARCGAHLGGHRARPELCPACELAEA